MFDKYYDEQQVASTTLINAIKNNKLSHAYIFEINNYKNYYEYIMQFVKYIFCEESRKSGHDESNCKICSQINSDNYVELKILNPQSLQIKKDDVLLLQEEFNKKPIIGNKKIYIITNAEKLNSSSANTILKFLEEPEEDIIAILVTPSRYMLMKTIISRCQIIAFNNSINKVSNIKEKIYNDYFVTEDKNEELDNIINKLVDNTICFVEHLERDINETMLFSNTYFLNNFREREDVIRAFEIMKLLYYDALKSITNDKLEYFNDYKDIIIKIVNNNSIDKISGKLQIIISTIDKLKYNVNIPLTIDKFLMEIGGK